MHGVFGGSAVVKNRRAALAKCWESHRPYEQGDYPHLVELSLPSGGFRSLFDDMQAFHRERGIQSRRARGRNHEAQFYVRYCFADPAHADAFRDRFGGERLTGKPSRRSRSGSVA